MRNTIAVAGNMIIDKIKLLRTFPARHELTGILSVEESLGGAACNVGMDLARLDPSLPVRVFGVAGADADGDKVLRAFGAFPNIDVSRVRRRGQSSFTDVLTEEQGRARTFLTFGGSNADFRETDVEADALSDVKLFHIGYILLLDALDAPDDEYGTKMARLLHNVQAAGALTSVDVVSEAGDRFQRRKACGRRSAPFGAWACPAGSSCTRPRARGGWMRTIAKFLCAARSCRRAIFREPWARVTRSARARFWARIAEKR